MRWFRLFLCAWGVVFVVATGSQAACTTSMTTVAGISGSAPRYFICALFADRPTSGLNAGDRLYVTATKESYTASNATTWVSLLQGAALSSTVTAGTQGSLSFVDGTTPQWLLLKQTDNTLLLYDPVTPSTLWTVTRGVTALAITPNPVSTMKGLSITQSGPITGSQGTSFNFNEILVIGEAMNVGAVNNPVNALYVLMQSSGGANSQGTRIAVFGIAQLLGAQALAGDVIGVVGEAFAQASGGGTNTGAGAKGTIFGMASFAQASSGATNLHTVSGGEVDVGILTGASARNRLGWSIVGIGQLSGAVYDMGLEIAALTRPWDTGIAFTSYHGAAGVSTTGTLIGTDGVAMAVANGIDFSAFSMSGHFLKGPASLFSVNGLGAITGVSLTTPLIVGGSAVGSSLTLKSTTGVGTTDFIDLLVGSNGATQGARVAHDGTLLVGTTTVQAGYKFVVAGSLSFNAVNPAINIANASRAWLVQMLDADNRFRLYDNTSGVEALALAPVTGLASLQAIKVIATAGAGYVELPTQSAPPSAPATGYREYADSTGRRAWIRAADGFTRTWDATLTANRVYTLQDNSGTLSSVVSATRPNQALTNSAAADADFTSVYSIPANKLVAGKWLRVTLYFNTACGVTPATQLAYLKLGATKLWAAASATAPTASVTRTFKQVYEIMGTAAAGASVAVEVAALNMPYNTGGESSIAAVNVATNGTLTIVPGVTWGSNTNLDTLTLVNALVEELN